MKKHIYNLWVKMFARKEFERFNNVLFNLAIRSLGVSNYENYEISGEKWLVNKFLKKVITRSNPVFFDVGAYLGHYTKLLLNSFPNSNVYAFEPHPANYDRLSKNLKYLKNCSFVNCGLGEKIESKKLYDYSTGGGTSHATMFKGVIDTIHSGDESSIEVSIETLDSICNSNSLDFIDFLKIDVEGMEYNCLLGGKNLLREKRIGIIQFEFNEMNMISRIFMQDFFDLLQDYSLYRLLPNDLLPLKRKDVLKTNLYRFQNIVAIPDSYNIKL